MQNTTLPIFSSVPATTSNATPQRQNNAASSDGAQFAQTLSRQVQQRQLSEKNAQPIQPIKVTNIPVTQAPAPAPSAPSAPVSESSGPVEASVPDETTPICLAPPATDKGGTSASDGSKSDADVDTSAAGSSAAADQIADLMASLASFNQPAVAAPAVAQVPVADSKRPDQQAAASDLAAAADTSLLTPVTTPAIAQAAVKGETGQGQPQMFDRARAGKAIGLDTASAPATKLATADAAETPAAGTAESAAAAAAAATDNKAASFASMVQAKVEAAPRPGERSELPAAHELAPATTQTALSAPVQQASLAVAQATGTPTDRLAARVGTPAWDNQVGQKIIWMAAGQEQSATLTLNPPDMGPMQVVLSVTNDQAQVTFSAAQPEVRAALEQAMPKLREMMSESGIALGNATVNDGSAEQRQAQQGEQARGRAGFGAGSERAGNQAATVEVPVRRGGRILGGAGAVDTFA